MPGLRRIVGKACDGPSVQARGFFDRDSQGIAGAPVPPVRRGGVGALDHVRVDGLLTKVDRSSELEVIRFAA